MGLFGIGTYQSVSGGTVYNGGGPWQPYGFFQNYNPQGGVGGGTYGFIVDATIKQPQTVVKTPPQLLGLDTNGVAVVRGYPQLTWGYSTMRPDDWYYLKWVYTQSSRSLPAYQYFVLLQYPDPEQNGALTQILARMEPPVYTSHITHAFQGVTLKFTYVGQTQLAPGVPIVVLS
jgi:hypothetical protein